VFVGVSGVSLLGAGGRGAGGARPPPEGREKGKIAHTLI
jgi:hypothetical protein